MNNPYSILISVDYSPNEVGNHQFSNDGYNEYILNSLIVDDSGYFSVTNSLFENIPEGAIVTINISRFNCKEAKRSNDMDVLLF